MKISILAVLQNAWTDETNYDRLNKRKPLWFHINPLNKTGKKLYRITKGYDLRVTNVCPEWKLNPREKGKSDIDFVSRALKSGDYLIYLVCGNQAIETFKKYQKEFSKVIDFRKKIVIFMPHPASRTLTNKLLDEVKRELWSCRNEIKLNKANTCNHLGCEITYKQKKGFFETELKFDDRTTYFFK